MMKSSISELDNATVIKHWNNQKLTNAQVAAKLDAPWGLVRTKARAVKSVAEYLTVAREGGKEGTWSELDSEVKPETVAKKAAATSRKVSGTARTTRASTSGRFKLHVKLLSSSSSVVAERDFDTANAEEAVQSMQNLMTENRVTKTDMFRDGVAINATDLASGDSITLRPTIYAGFAAL